ncbi:16S rRNA (cytosine(1402)-N(4))-methyltransferase, partial [candidate division WOR-3 bacterium]|nr:16S rRNA (cytosine(1402)-N(4))-methyltransferase [candidate division WOR-3 bacterium]
MIKEKLHRPVMVDEVIEWLDVEKGNLYLDATLGCGGHSLAILKNGKASVIGIDLDREQIEIAKERLSPYTNRFLPVQGNFRFIDRFIGVPLDGVLFDLGYSSYQLNNPEKGFSYRLEGALDMRYGDKGLTALDIVRDWDADEIADMLYYYGGERRSRVIARKIKNSKPTTTGELALLVRKSV